MFIWLWLSGEIERGDRVDGSGLEDGREDLGIISTWTRVIPGGKIVMVSIAAERWMRWGPRKGRWFRWLAGNAYLSEYNFTGVVGVRRRSELTAEWMGSKKVESTGVFSHCWDFQARAELRQHLKCAVIKWSQNALGIFIFSNLKTVLAAEKNCGLLSSGKTVSDHHNSLKWSFHSFISRDDWRLLATLPSDPI